MHEFVGIAFYNREVQPIYGLIEMLMKCVAIAEHISYNIFAYNRIGEIFNDNQNSSLLCSREHTIANLTEILIQ